MDVEGVILAAGYGKRLRPLTDLRAKPSIPFLNRPLIQYSLEMLEATGVENAFINLHHLPESVLEAARGTRLSLRYSYEEEILGTAGALGRLKPLIQAQTVVAANGKIYFEENLKRALNLHLVEGAWATLVVVPYRKGRGYNPVFLDSDGAVTGFGHPDPARGAQTPHVYTGVQFLDRRLLDSIPCGFSDSVKDLYPRLIAEGRRLMGYVSQGFWCECSLPDRYLRRSLQVLRRSGRDNLGPPEALGGCSGVIAAADVRVEPGSLLNDSVLWEGSRVGAGCRLENVILAGASLPSHTELRKAIVTPAPHPGSAPPPGAKVLEQCLIWPLIPTRPFNGG